MSATVTLQFEVVAAIVVASATIWTLAWRLAPPNPDISEFAIAVTAIVTVAYMGLVLFAIVTAALHGWTTLIEVCAALQVCILLLRIALAPLGTVRDHVLRSNAWTQMCLIALVVWVACWTISLVSGNLLAQGAVIAVGASIVYIVRVVSRRTAGSSEPMYMDVETAAAADTDGAETPEDLTYVVMNGVRTRI